MARSDLLVCLLFLFIHNSNQAGNAAPPTSIILNAIDVPLSETEKTKKDLFGGPIVECDDEDQTRAFIKTISPASPCGKQCFMLERCGAPNVTEFCLFFVPGQGNLNYNQVSLYKLTIGCTDDVEPVATKDMTISIEPNTPPQFLPALPSTFTIPGTSKAGVSVFSAAASDKDGDPIYYTMNLSPSTPYLSIGYTNGIVKTTHDLRYLCESKITATFKATDNINPAIGPKTVVFDITPHNTPPTITNLDTTLTLKENSVAANALIFTPSLVDDKIGSTPPLTFHMTSVSSAGLEMYKIDPATGKITANYKPDYERLDTRSVTLYIDVTDGYCSSPVYSLTINIEDVNEPPTLAPSPRKQVDVYEGNVVSPSGITLLDEDLNDAWTYSKVGATPPEFTVDPTSGDIISTAPIDIDKKTVSKSYTLTYIATDKGGNVSNTATVTILVHDINDNAPFFKATTYSFSATECTEVGSPLGNVYGDDFDSSYKSNDKLVFGGGGGKMSVMSDGTVVLTQACLDGEIGSGEATITDQGEYPGPLTGLDVPITLTCGPCPPPPPPVTAPVATTKATATATTKATGGTGTGTGTGNTKGGISDYLGWIIPAIIGGLIWLALMGFLIYRYCFPCRNPCEGRCVRKPKAPKPPPKAPEPKPPKPEKPKKLPPPPPALSKPAPPPPPPPPPPAPKPDPYLFGFWKEQFTDQDHLKQPARATKPAPIENMPPAEVVPRGNAIPPENLKLGNPGIGQWNPKPAAANQGAAPADAQAAPKKSTCVVS